MNKILAAAAVVALGALAGTAWPAAAAPITSTEMIDGTCSAESHTAEGPIGSDLTKRQSRFYCSAMVLVTFEPHHVLVQFAEKASYNNPLLGFGGVQDGLIINVQHLYIQNSEPLSVTESGCKFFFQANRLTSVFCGAHVDQGARRTTAVVVFKPRSR
jgi:hypothetical protein